MQAYLRNEHKLFLLIIIVMALLIGSYVLFSDYAMLGWAMLATVAATVVVTMLVGVLIGGIIAFIGSAIIGIWIIMQSLTFEGQAWLSSQSFSLALLLLFAAVLLIVFLTAGYLHAQLKNLATENEAMQHQVADLVAVDVDTHFDNSKRMCQEVDREVKRVQRHGGRFTLLFVQFDHYHEFLKAYGEKEMQHVLWTIAKKVNETLRNSDYKYRYNNQKFAFLLVETPKQSVEIVIDKLHEQLREHELLNGKKVTLAFHISFDEYDETNELSAKEFIQNLERETVFYAM